jgi:hypothetical protein
LRTLECVDVHADQLERGSANFLDKGQWPKLRTSVPGYLIALTYINAAYPDPDNPTDFFWGRDGTFDQAQPFFS